MEDLVIKNAVVESEAMNSGIGAGPRRDEVADWLDYIREDSRDFNTPMDMRHKMMCVCMPSPPYEKLSDVDPARVVWFRNGPFQYCGNTMSLGLPLFAELIDDSK